MRTICILFFFASRVWIMPVFAVTPSSPLPSPSPRFHLRERTVKDGSLAVIETTAPVGNEMTGWCVEFEEIRSPFFKLNDQKPSNYIALLAIPHHHKAGVAVLSIHATSCDQGHDLSHDPSPVQVLQLKIVDAHYSKESLKVSPKFTSPNKSDLEQLEADKKGVEEIYKRITSERYWSGPFHLPVKSRITSRFGTNRVFNGELQSFHNGLDLKASIGTPVRASGAGKVVLAKSLFFTGNTVILDHGFGLFTLYAHLSQIRVHEGDQVTGMSIIGLSGKTGRAKGPHLHWGTMIQGVKFDPLDLMHLIR